MNYPLSWIQIDAAAFAHNARVLKQLIGNSALAAVIKSNAYGHGLAHIVTLIERSPEISHVCTASLSEARAARAYGCTKPIIVLSIIDENPADGAHTDTHISFVISTIADAQLLNHVGAQRASHIPVHLKIDTGLSRFGVSPDKAPALINQIKQLPYINLVGACTHFAQSPSHDQAYTHAQEAQFEQFITSSSHSFEYIHAANSAATLTGCYGSTRANLVRVGLSLYGWWPSPFAQAHAQIRMPSCTLQPVMTIKSRLIHIKHVPPCTPIGYNGTYVTARPTRIGIMPLGYFDGYDFRFGNTAHVIINGINAPVIGRICMNQTILDITDVPDAHEGTIITVLDHTYASTTAPHLTQLMGLDNVRILLTRFGAHIPRIITNAL